MKLREEELGANCPVCGKKLRVRIFEYDIPRCGEMIFLIIFCPSCNFRVVDEIPKEIKGKKVLRIKIRKKEDLGIKILKNRRAIVRIPEYGIEIVENRTEIITVEGLINRIEERFGEEAKEIVESLKKVEKEFTIEIEDEEGISKIINF